MGQSALEKRVAKLEAELEELSSRPGRKPKPIKLSEPGVCAVDPSIDSSECPHSSIYRYQQGCKGLACTALNRAYYAEYRQKNKGDVEQAEVPVKEPPKEPVKRRRTKVS